jgi:hypothetical protein
MIASASRPVLPRAKRKPSPRNMQIYEEVRVLEQRQADVAQRHGISQRRVSEICQQVDAWHAWVQSAPNLEEIEKEMRRTALLQARKRAEQILFIAVKHVAKETEQLVTERRTIQGDRTTVDRTVRELPIDAEWLKVAQRTSSDIARITESLGVDVEPSQAGLELDALLAALVEQQQEGERERAEEGDRNDEPKEGSNSSSCSKVNGELSPGEVFFSAQEPVLNCFAGKSCVETEEQRAGDKRGAEIPEFTPAKVFYERECGIQPASTQPSHVSQITTPKLSREVRERRVCFLQSCSEPEDDKTRLMKKAPR